MEKSPIVSAAAAGFDGAATVVTAITTPAVTKTTAAVTTAAVTKTPIVSAAATAVTAVTTVAVTTAAVTKTTAAVTKTIAAVTKTTAAVTKTTAAVTKTTAAAASSSKRVAVSAGKAAGAAAASSSKRVAVSAGKAAGAAAAASESSMGCGTPGCRNSQKRCCSDKQCPSCLKFGESFCCKICVKNGDFGPLVPDDRFFKKLNKDQNITRSFHSIDDDSEAMLEIRKSLILKKREYLILKERIMLLNLAIAHKNNKEKNSRGNCYGKRGSQQLTKKRSTSLESLVQPHVNQPNNHILSLGEVHPSIRVELPDIDRQLNNKFAEKLLLSSSVDNSDSKDDN